MGRIVLKNIAGSMIGALAVVLTACATAHTPQPAVEAVADVAATEAAFRAHVGAEGVVPAFRRYVGDEAIMFLPEPVVINPRLADAAWPGDIDWWPRHAFASRAGDVVVTTGPSLWTVGSSADAGYYFTVWVRDGQGYRFKLDGNAPQSADLTGGPRDLSAAYADPSTLNGRDPEADFLAASTANYPAALTRALSASSVRLRPGQSPIVGQGATSEPTTIRHAPGGGGASAEGDLRWSYGVAEWSDASGPRRGAYVRAWMWTASGWALVLDHRSIIDP